MHVCAAIMRLHNWVEAKDRIALSLMQICLRFTVPEMSQLKTSYMSNDKKNVGSMYLNGQM